MNRTTSNITAKVLLLMTLILVVVPQLFGGGKVKKSNNGVEADARKADYIYFEAKRQNLQSHTDSYFDLMDYARALNPDDKLLGMELGLYYAHLDTVNPSKGIDLMEEYVMSAPEDMYNAYVYAQLASRSGNPARALEAWRLLHERFPSRLPLTQKYAQALMSTRDSSNIVMAIELYDTLELRGADPIDVISSRALAKINLGDSAGVRSEVSRLIGRNPRSAIYNIFGGQIYQSLLDSDSAIVFYNRAVELDPNNGMAYYARANFYNEANDSVAFDREVFNALRQDDLETDVKLALMRDYVIKLAADSTQRPRITELFEILAAQHPHEPEILNLYTDYLISTSNYPAAAEQLGYSLDLNPDNQHGWIVLSSLLLQSDEFAAAADAASRGLKYFPGDMDLTQLEITGLINNDDLDGATSLLDRTIASADTTDVETMSELWSMRGDILYKKELLDSAMISYEKALDYNPVNYLAMNNAAYYLACSGGDLDRALELIEIAVTGRQEDATTLDTYAWVLFKRKEYQKAREIIDRVLEIEEDPSEELLEHAGDIYFWDSEPDEALKFWKRALEKDPDNGLLKRKVEHKTYFFK
ncbi:MAG: tetratricopeptide repeat protein [Clostridium sp.]|nr:tetratricopeptide repeat protein [Clostridium sp.]